MLVEISPRLREYGAVISYMVVDEVTVRPSSEKLLSEISRIVGEFRARYKGLEGLKDDPVIQAYRKAMWRLGIDPTKIRPSSEALARRVLRGEELPRINNVVDAGNASSLANLVPIGLYDLDKLQPPVTLTLCESQCRFEPIGGEARVLGPGTPVLLDSSGHVVHVYPYRDSAKTSISESTVKFLAVAAGFPGVPPGRLNKSLEELVRLLEVDGLSPVRSRIEVV